jgi:hypothetical protein
MEEEFSHTKYSMWNKIKRIEHDTDESNLKHYLGFTDGKVLS